MDVVVTLPLNFRLGGLKGLAAWIAEGNAAGDPEPPEGARHYRFTVGGGKPVILPGERVYIVHNRKLRGYAPLVRLDQCGPRSWDLVRCGNAVAVTIPEQIPGFRGFRYRWWDRAIEVPFPDWRTP